MEPEYMALEKTEYKKLPGKNRKLIGNDTLWMGKDHLLLVESSGIAEQYKRFYFKDIQAFNIIKTKTTFLKKISLSILLAATIFSGKIMWDNYNVNGLILFPVIVGVIFIFYLIHLFINGASCKCWIYSSVQKERLTPINTIKTAKKLLDDTIPKIEEIQGILSLDALDSAKDRVSANPGVLLKNAANRPEKTISLIWHKISFLVLMVLSIALLVSLFLHPPAIVVANTILFFGAIALSTVAVARQAGSRLKSWVKTITISSMVFLIIGLTIGYMEYMYFFMTNIKEWATVSHNQWETIKLVAQINPFDYPLILGKDITLIICFFFTGIAGLISTWKLDQ